MPGSIFGLSRVNHVNLANRAQIAEISESRLAINSLPARDDVSLARGKTEMICSAPLKAEATMRPETAASSKPVVVTHIVVSSEKE